MSGLKLPVCDLVRAGVRRRNYSIPEEKEKQGAEIHTAELAHLQCHEERWTTLRSCLTALSMGLRVRDAELDPEGKPCSLDSHLHMG